jgi:putative Mg2+ transporter-C (MgtC) family protein
MISTVEILIRLVVAAVCGSVIGYQREITERPAGFRTHVLVCTGSALIMMVSIYPFGDTPRVDPTRIAAQVVTGIGFLGAGTIIRQGSIVRGLTTAASLWTISGVGLAVGAGFYSAALLTTVLVLVVLSGFKIVETRIIGTKGARTILVRSEDRPGMLGKIGAALGQMNVNIRNIEMTQEEGGLAQIRLGLELPRALSHPTVIEQLMQIEGLKGVEWEE